MRTGLPGWRSAVLTGSIMAAIIAISDTARADRNGFYLRNTGDEEVSSVYVSPMFSKRWRGDRLDVSGIEPGQDIWVQIENPDGDCFFDIRVEDTTGTPYEYWGIDLCGTRILSVP